MTYNTSNFTGGLLPVIPDASKIPEGSYRIARNVRVRDNTVRPVADPLNLSLGLPDGSIQGGEEMGAWGICFIAGNAYARYLLSDTTIWRPILGYRLSSTVTDIFTVVVPRSFNAYKRDNYGDTPAAIPQVANGFYSDQGGGIPCLIAQDGINQPMVIHPDASGLSFSCRSAGTYETWTVDNPEYVPIGKQMGWDGNRLHIVIKGRFAFEAYRAVAKSVNNRPLDFMVVLDFDGNKLLDETQGDARITSYGVDFDEITGLKVVNNNQVAVIVSTAKSLWQAVPDYTNTDFTFGEPIYRPIFIAAVGAINNNSFAETTINIDAGSTAFISQAGIRAVAMAAQNRFEGRNYPLSREISTLLSGIVQQNGAAVQWNDYTYFSLDTIHGQAILVYDSTLSKWVSVDKFSSMSQGVLLFMVVRAPGQQRLLALTRNGIFAMEEGSTFNPGIYIGDYSSIPQDGIRVEHTPDIVRLNFINNELLGEVHAELFCDERFSQDLTATLSISQYSTRADSFPYAPRLDNANTTTIAIYSPIQCFRHGYWVSWNTNGELSYLAVDTTDVKITTSLEQKSKTFSDNVS